MSTSTVVVGEVSNLEGMVRAIDPVTQEVRILDIGDVVFKGEVLVTSSPANVILTLNDGEMLILGRNSELFLGSDVVGDDISEDEAVVDVATLQRFVLEGNFEALAEPAAGDASPGSAVEQAALIERTAAEGEVTAGFKTRSATFVSSIIDDPFDGGLDRDDEGLLAKPDVNVINEDAVSVGGNVIQGAGNDLLGADQLVTDATYVVNVDGVAVGNATVIVGEYGSLEIAADGGYTYILDNGNSNVQRLTDGQSITDVFTYTLQDGDNDTSSTTLTITINGVNDASPVIVIEDADGSATSSDNSVTEGTGEIVSGTMTVSAEVGIAEVTLDGQDITNASVTPVVITTAEGEILTVTGYDPTTGVITYTFEEANGSNDHTDGSVINRFTLEVTDNEGKTNSDTLDIEVLDTAPEAKDDVNSLTEDDVDPVTGNVMTAGAGADTIGADVTTVTSVDGNSVTSSQPATIVGTYGTLVLNSDGSYSYTLDNSNSVVQALTSSTQPLSESFDYIITDFDGDSSSATLTITIHGVTGAPPEIVIEDADGSATSSDNSVTEGTGEIVSGTMTVSAEVGIA
ncbi:T1SS secreted agglutinin RTX, partial [hydrothermal vent metagenome]